MIPLIASRQNRERQNDAVSRAIKTLSSRFLCFRLVRDSHVLNRVILVQLFSHRTEKLLENYFGDANTRFRIARGINFSIDDRATLLIFSGKMLVVFSCSGSQTQLSEEIHVRVDVNDSQMKFI